MNPEENEKKEIELETFNEFSQDLDKFLEKWRENKNLPSRLLSFGLLYEAKLEMCFHEECYYCASGHLNHILNHDFQSMFEDINKFIEKEEENENNL